MEKALNQLLLAVELTAFFGMELYCYYGAGYTEIQSWIVGAIACIVARCILIDIIDYYISKEEEA